MDIKRRQPIGIELVKKGLITEEQVRVAIDYQKSHQKEKLGDIIHIMNVCDEYQLINAIGDILGEKAMVITSDDIKVKVEDYIPIDTLKASNAILFDVMDGKGKVCFADVSDSRTIESVRLLLLNKGLVMDRYISFKSNIQKILSNLSGKASDKLVIGSDITEMIDSIIKTAMEKRTSDIHFEPMDDKLRVRFRIDGELFNVAEIDKDKQQQIIGRLKAISNMHQEKQESQDRKDYSLS